MRQEKYKKGEAITLQVTTPPSLYPSHNITITGNVERKKNFKRKLDEEGITR